MEEKATKKYPDFPTYCKRCRAKLDCMPYLNDPARYVDEQGRECRVIGYDVFTGEPRSFEYTVVCRTDPSHTQLKVVETPSVGFRCVIRASEYDENRVRKG